MKNTYRIIGIMSGTSLDGVDIALCEFTKDKSWNYAILCAETVKYSDLWKTNLANLENDTAISFAKNDALLGRYFGLLTNDFIVKNNLDKASIDAIASHGHTIFHQPELFLTSQIGSGAQIAAVTEMKTVCDFRTVDVGLGGQGAPLVPIGDQLLFKEYSACLNLGGIANISFEVNNQRISFDIGLANMVGNYLCQQTTKGYDENGALASSGQLNFSLLNEMNALAFFEKSYPKSLGKEFFVETFRPILDACEDTIANKLHTFGVHLGIQIGKSIPDGDCLVTGGGAFNDFWMSEIQKNSKGKIVKPIAEIIEYKEALIFAFLGLLRLENQPNALSTVTGASVKSCGGCVYEPF